MCSGRHLNMCSGQHLCPTSRPTLRKLPCQPLHTPHVSYKSIDPNHLSPMNLPRRNNCGVSFSELRASIRSRASLTPMPAHRTTHTHCKTSSSGQGCCIIRAGVLCLSLGRRDRLLRKELLVRSALASLCLSHSAWSSFRGSKRIEATLAPLHSWLPLLP